MNRPYILKTQPGAEVLIVALHGYRQHPTKPANLPGRLGLPFIEFGGFDTFPFPVNVVYPVGERRNWRTRFPFVLHDLQYLGKCIRETKAETKATKVVLFGFSDGGTMVNELMQIAESCNCACVASGWVPQRSWKPLESIRVLLHSGDTGPVEKKALQQAIAAESIYQQAGADVTRIVTPGCKHDWPAKMNETLADFIRAAKR